MGKSEEENSRKVTRPNIEELDRLWEEATEGEWKHDLDEERPEGSITDASGYGIAIVFPYASVKTVMRTGQEFSHDDARAIVAHHNAWPSVSAYIRELEQENRFIESRLDDLRTIESEFYEMAEVAKHANARIEQLEARLNERECGDFCDEDEY